MERQIKKLVIDSGAFVKRFPIWEYAEEFYCVTDVIKEIKDRQTRHFIDALPVQLQFREPSEDSFRFIIDFTKKSGDYASLSLVDIKVLALTYELEVEAKMSASHLRTEPLNQRTRKVVSDRRPSSNSYDNIEGFFVSSKKECTVSEEMSVNEIDLCSQDDVEDQEEEFELSMDHVPLLDSHFHKHSYVDDYLMSSADSALLKHLFSFPFLKKVSSLFEAHRQGGNFNTILNMFKSSLSSSNNVSEVSWSSECISHSIARDFGLCFHHWPHFCRWFLHMLSCKPTELTSMSTDSEWTLSGLFELMSHSQDQNDVICFNEEVNKDHLLLVEETTKDVSLDVVGEETDEDYESGDAEDEDSGGWITPSNIQSLKHRRRGLRNGKGGDEEDKDRKLEKIEVACITVDFAMQNTLNHIGLNMIGVGGKIVKELRTFILRCYACFKTTDKMEKMFCPHCGHKTLKKVSVSLNPDGTRRLWISNRRPINIRGTKFSLPKPQGGKHAINPILTADQREAQQRASRLARLKNDPLNNDYDARTGGAPFMTRDVYSRSAQLGIRAGDKRSHTGTLYWERPNPNVPMKKGTSRRKKKI